MDRLHSKHFFTLFCSALLIMGSNVLLAQNNEETSSPIKIKVEEEAKEGVEINNAMFSFFSSDKYKDDLNRIQRIHPNSYHHIIGVSNDGDKVQLHDGSKWNVVGRGKNLVLNWVKNDEIFIKPSISWFSGCQYVLHNRTLNEIAEVNLRTAPSIVSSSTLRITHILPSENLIYLNDDTVWKIEPTYGVSQWLVGDRLMVGVNNHWRTTLWPQILINSETTEAGYCQAYFYGTVDRG